jgi:hypothetical protein
VARACRSDCEVLCERTNDSVTRGALFTFAKKIFTAYAINFPFQTPREPVLHFDTKINRRISSQRVESCAEYANALSVEVCAANQSPSKFKHMYFMKFSHSRMDIKCIQGLKNIFSLSFGFRECLSSGQQVRKLQVLTCRP